MDCNEAEELFRPYLLGALESEESESLESHAETCRRCALSLQGDGEAAARLAFDVPQSIAPSRIKQRLLSRIEADLHLNGPASWERGLIGLREALSFALLPHAAKIVASVSVLALVVSGVWFNSRLNQISQDNEQLSGQLTAASAREAHALERVRDQHYLTYEALRMSAAKETSVNMLQGTGWTSYARGVVIFSRAESKALLLVVDLPPLPADKVYQVWFIKDGHRYGAGVFTVDSTGFGQTVIIPLAPLAEFEAVGITVEPVGGSTGPTGTSVLKGDL